MPNPTLVFSLIHSSEGGYYSLVFSGVECKLEDFCTRVIAVSELCSRRVFRFEWVFTLAFSSLQLV